MAINLKKIDELFRSDAVELFCPYCGTKTYCLVNLTLCSNCESIISMTRSAVLKKDSLTVQSLEKINALTDLDYTSEENFESAINIYDELISSKGDIGYIYAKSLMLIKYSNYIISKINYEGHGFMEENYVYSQKSMNLVSNARLLLYKLISSAETNVKNNINSFNDAYFIFLAYIKLKKLKSAQYALNSLKKFKEDDNLNISYAELIFYINMADFSSAILLSEKLLNNGVIHLNILFYYAFAMFHINKFKQSNKVIGILQNYIKNESINNLKEDILIKSTLY